MTRVSVPLLAFSNLCTSLLLYRFLLPSHFNHRLISRVSQLTFPCPPSRSSTPPIPVRLHPSRAAGGGGDDGDVRERDEIRHDRRKERQHDRNISRAAPDKRCSTRNFKHAACELGLRSIPAHVHTHPTNRQTHAACRRMIHAATGYSLIAQEASTLCVCAPPVGGTAGLWRSCGAEEGVLQLPLSLSNLVISKLTFTWVWLPVKRTAEMSVTESCQRKIFFLYCRINTSAQFRCSTAASVGSRDFTSQMIPAFSFSFLT